MAIVLLFVVAVAFTLRPVPTPESDSECLMAVGIVTNISEGGVKDAVFTLKGHSQKFYVNRGLENWLDLQVLRSKFEGKEITIKYPDYWTPFNANNSIRHISKIEFEGQTVFSEMD